MDRELKETLAFATIHKNIIEPKTADQLQRYIQSLEDRIKVLNKFYDQVSQITGDFSDIKPEYVKRYLGDYLKQAEVKE